MPAPKTVTLFLMDGSPSGRIKCSLANWTGLVYLIPRTDLAKSKDRPELSQTGVYILLGTRDESGEDLAYIGQARERKNRAGVLGRVAEHVGEEKLDYFTHAILIVASNDSFGPTEISYLENAYYQKALASGRVTTMNGNDPSPGNVTEEKQAELDEFIDYSMIAIRSLGYRLFDPVDEAKSVSAHRDESSTDSEPLLHLEERGASARGRQTADGFVILAGSRVRPDVTRSVPDKVVEQRTKYADRVNSDHELLQDTLFSSPSAAASFLVGASANGKAMWKTVNNVSLGDLERAELGAAQGRY